MSRFDLHHKYLAACLHAVGLDASSTGTRLLSLSTIADAKISNQPWVNFQSAGWVSFQSAPTAHGLPGYPRDIEDDEEHSIPLKRPRGAEPKTGIETPEQDNDSVD